MLKRIVDENDARGQYYLTGSQNILMLKTVSESLLGRMGIFHLEPMTQYELAGFGDHEHTWLDVYLHEGGKALLERFAGTLSHRPLDEAVWRGGLPDLIGRDAAYVSQLLRAYMTSFLERDVRNFGAIENLSEFRRFVSLCAALSGQLINYSKMGQTLSLPVRQSRQWLSVLQQSYLWREVEPYLGDNQIKRLSKTPKGYFTDTGLLCAQLMIHAPELVHAHPSWGHIFKTWVVNEIFQLSTMSMPYLQAYHWRVNAGSEVDVILDYNGQLYPIEIKSMARPGAREASGLRAFMRTHKKKQIATGLIIHAGNECYRIDEDIIALPWHALVS